MSHTNKYFPFAINWARNLMNFWPRGFLNKDNIKIILSLKNGVDDKQIFPNILQKNFEISYNHCCCLLFVEEQIDLVLLSWISEYFFCCHSLLNLCLQNGHKLESAWWLPQQFEHLNVWGHGSPFFILSRGRLNFSFALQHHPNLRWFSDLWGLLHLIHLDPWILHENIA